MISIESTGIVVLIPKLCRIAELGNLVCDSSFYSALVCLRKKEKARLPEAFDQTNAKFRNEIIRSS